MATTTAQALPYPTLDDSPDGPGQIQSLAQAVEKKLVQRYASASDRAAKIGPVAQGMFVWLDDSAMFWYYTGTAWVPLQTGAELAYGSSGGSSNSSGDGIEVTTGAVATFSIPNRRKVHVDFSLTGHSENTPRAFRATLRRKSGTGVPGTGATFVKHAQSALNGGLEVDCSGWAREVLDAGTYSYGLDFTSFGDFGHKVGVDADGNPTPATVLVTDMGPA